MNWKEQWEKDKPGSVGASTDYSAEEMWKWIETEIIEKLINDLESNPSPFASKADASYTTLPAWIEAQQRKLRAKWLGKK